MGQSPTVHSFQGTMAINQISQGQYERKNLLLHNSQASGWQSSRRDLS